MLITKLSFAEFIFKRALKNIAVGAALVVASIFESPEASAQKIQKKPTTTISSSNKALENKIKKLLANKTWEDNTLKYTFSTGDTMWIEIGDDEPNKGKWKLNGNKLTIINTNRNTSETFKVKVINKDYIMLGDTKFHYNVDPVD
jgi:hypothetical protein